MIFPNYSKKEIMTILKYCFWILFAFLMLFFGACKSEPIIPDGGIQIPIEQDPGDENPCPEGVISFQHEVLPIMISACAYSGCHDAATAEDDVVLDSYENVIKEVTPGDPNDSELYESITETDQDDIMPPPPASPLTSAQIRTIKDWISQGAENTNCGAPCDSTASSFASDIFPLLQNYCIGCHNVTRADGNVDIDSYDKIIPYVENGQLVGTMAHEPLFIKMPPGGSKVSDCRIAQVQKWINEGAQDN